MGIRVLHFSDAHVGVETYGHFDPATGLNSRLLDFGQTLDAIVREAALRDVDLVLFTGDAYRTRDPSPTQQREFATRIRRLAETGTPVFLLVGNHDRPNTFGRAHSVDIFNTLGVPNVYIGATPATTVVNTRKGPVQITALPWLPRSFVVSRDDARGLTPEQTRDALRTKILAFIRDEASRIDPAVPGVLAAHVAVEGVEYGSGFGVAGGEELLIPRAELANPAWDYVALGHIHQQQEVSKSPPARYAGSLERVDFGEEGDKKGYVLVDLATTNTSAEFRELETRQFLTVRVDARAGDPTALTLTALANEQLAGKIVRVIVQISDLRTRVDAAAIRQALKPAYSFAGLSTVVDRADDARARVESLPRLGPVEALDRYLTQLRKVPPERTALLCDRTGRMLAELTAGTLEVNE